MFALGGRQSIRKVLGRFKYVSIILHPSTRFTAMQRPLRGTTSYSKQQKLNLFFTSNMFFFLGGGGCKLNILSHVNVLINEICQGCNCGLRPLELICWRGLITHTVTHRHTVTHTHTVIRTNTITHTYTVTHNVMHTHTVTHNHIVTHPYNVTHTVKHTHNVTDNHNVMHTHTMTHAQCHTHAHCDTH